MDFSVEFLAPRARIVALGQHGAGDPIPLLWMEVGLRSGDVFPIQPLGGRTILPSQRGAAVPVPAPLSGLWSWEGQEGAAAPRIWVPEGPGPR